MHLRVRSCLTLALAICIGGCGQSTTGAANETTAANGPLVANDAAQRVAADATVTSIRRGVGPQNVPYKRCPGDGTTPTVRACQNENNEKAEIIYNRYKSAALKRIRNSDEPRRTEVINLFNAGQAAFVKYRQETCGAVFEYWADGTIAPSFEADCQLRLTQLQTHTIWSQWLTYVDSTPPILPEPDVAAMPWERWRRE